MTGPAPRWPDFFIVGAPRSGTSWLYRALRDHPGAFLPDRKEPHHLSPDLDGGTAAEAAWRVRDQDDYTALFLAARRDQRVGEASTGYLASLAAPARIADVSPGARVIVMVRDPVEQIASCHARRVAAGVEDLDLRQALDAESDRLVGRHWPRRPVFMPQAQYRDGARFIHHIERYIEQLGRDVVWVGLLDDIANDAHGTYQSVLAHLGLAPRDPPELGRVNENEAVRARRIHRALHSPGLDLALERVPSPLRPLAGATLRGARRITRRAAPRHSMPADLRDRLREESRADVEALGAFFHRDLIALWWRD